MNNPIPKIRQFYFDTLQEVKKCTWPTNNELIESTVIVLVALVLVSSFIWGIDTVIQQLVRFFILS